MLVDVHAKRVAATLRREFPQVRRIVMARTDGLPFYDRYTTTDDLPSDTQSSAAVAAALLGLGDHVSMASRHGELTSAIVRSENGCVIVYRASEGYVLAIHAEPTINLVLLDRVARKAMADLVTVGG